MAPPVEAGKWEFRFASTEAADGWEKLCANIPTAASACWHALSDAPLAYAERRKQLRDEFATRVVGGMVWPANDLLTMFSRFALGVQGRPL